MITALALSLSISSVAGADVKRNRSAQVQLELPDAWRTDVKDEVLIARDPTDEVGLMFWVVARKESKEALRDLDVEIAKVVKDAHWGAPKEITINGMHATVLDGTGIVGGKRAGTSVFLVGPTPTHKRVIIFGAIEDGKQNAHTRELLAIFQSLKPMS